VTFFSAHIDNLRKLYVNQVQMLLSNRTQIIDALPKMVEKATDRSLKEAFQTHLEETKGHAIRLEEVLVKDLNFGSKILTTTHGRRTDRTNPLNTRGVYCYCPLSSKEVA
jgi:ferritin-like metal-binding protein YciE